MPCDSCMWSCMMVAPVVVKPDIASKKASLTL